MKKKEINIDIPPEELTVHSEDAQSFFKLGKNSPKGQFPASQARSKQPDSKGRIIGTLKAPNCSFTSGTPKTVSITKNSANTTPKSQQTRATTFKFPS